METSLLAVRVQEVILDENNDRYESLGGSRAVGTILYTLIDEVTPLNRVTKDLPFARPLFSGFFQYPTVNEIVYLIEGPTFEYYDDDSTIAYYIPPAKIQNHSLHNAFPNVLEVDNEILSNEETENGAQTSADEYSLYLGKYFKELENIRPLRPYEGDTLLEGRFGNSIRLGATTFNDLPNKNRWSNEGEIGNPITIIRNGQIEDKQGESFEHILEDVDGDDSSIYLCSKQQLTNFTPASIYNLSFGANLELNEDTTEPEPIDEPMPENVEEELPPVTPPTPPPPLPPEPEEEEEIEEIAEYDDAQTENQTIFPTDDLGDLPYNNPENIDFDRVLGSYDPPAVHNDAAQTYMPPSSEQIYTNGPYGFYISEDGFDTVIDVKDKNMETIYKEASFSYNTEQEFIEAVKQQLFS